jgi:hypothetical protein
MAKQLPPYTASSSDRPAFEVMVRVRAKLRQPDSSPSPGFVAQLRGLLASFGMTPIDRARLAPPMMPMAGDPVAEEFFR